MVKVLTRLKIKEVSAVDRGAGDGVRVMLMKRKRDQEIIAKSAAALEESVRSIFAADIDDATKRSALAESFAQYQAYMENAAEPMGKGKLERVERRYRQRFEKIFSKAGDGDGDGDGVHDGGHDDASAQVVDHHVSRIADLVVEASGGKTDRSAALSYLMLTPSGSALLHRTRSHKGDTPVKDSLQKVKDIGIVGIAKMMVDEQKSYGLSEHEFVAALTAYAAEQYPQLRPDVAFAKLYEGEEIVRRAVAVAKASWPSPLSLEPLVSTGTDAFPSTRLRPGSARTTHEDDSTLIDQSDAYAKLTRLAEQQRRDTETSSQAFARIYTDPANRNLVAAERAQNQPNTIYTNVTPEPTPSVEKSATTGAYGELMAKAIEYRKLHPELSEAQAFEAIYTAPANRELAKRERQESTPTSYGF